MGRISLFPDRKQKSSNDSFVSTKNVLELECKKLKLECKNLKKMGKMVKKQTIVFEREAEKLVTEKEKLEIEKEKLQIEKEKLQQELNYLYAKANTSSGVIYASQSNGTIDMSQLLDLQNVTAMSQ